MKNLKKVLAMVLAFACTFTMFASAKVYEDVQPGTEFSEAITMLSDLGIIQGKTDNKYHPEDTITRAEACALIARLMTGDPNAAGFNGAHHFKDVPAGHWASSAIGYAVVNGIAVGVDQAGTKFEPNRPIKDKEFVTMIVRALGYETPDMRNNFPFGYMSAANAIGLLQDVNMVPDTDALRGEDAQVIYNAMFVDYARGAKRVNVAHGTTVEKYPTLAEDVWHLDRAAVGTWDKHDKDDETVKLSNCKAHTWVIVGQDGDDNILAYPIEDGNTEKDSHEIYESLENKVNGVKAAAYKFKYEGAADIDTLRGYKVELWGAGKHGEPSWEKKEGKYVFSNDWKIKAIKTIAGQTKFDYDASKADSKRDDGEIKVDDETTLKLGTAADNAQKVSEKNTSKTDRTTYLSKEEYNRENVTSDKKVEAALNVRDGAQYRLMDWDGDKEIDWVVVSEASYYKVEAVSSKRLTVTSMVDVTKNKKNEEDETESLTQTWKIGDDNEIFIGKDKKNSYKVKYEVPEGLKEGDIIEVAYSTGWDKITGTVSVVEPENHKLEKVATKNHLVLTFDGEVTELAENRNEADTIVPENPSKYIDFDEEELGREFAIAKNRNGFIIHSDYATEGGDYMMVLDTDDGSNKVRGELGAMKIITDDNKVLDNVEVVSDLMIDRKTSGNGYDKDSRHFDEHQVVGNVYRYWKDADGKITKMETVVDGTQAASYEYVAKNDRLTLKDNKQSYALKDAKTIFAVKPHSADSSYIQHVGESDLKVDDADVLAVKQADIPDIGVTHDDDADTYNAPLDVFAVNLKSWVKGAANTIAFDTNNNKDIKGAVLGVNSFNKFNAGSTKVGLVTNVAFDSKGVVSLDVATNGKTDTLASAEKVKFEDIVSVKDYENDKSVSVASRTETINNGIMKGSNLKDSLYKNGAYAEITTDKDGKLTGVLFMDKKNKDDGDVGGVNHDNVVIGNYYQVSRKVIADVKTGSWMSVVEGSALYAGKDSAFDSLDTKNTQKASDFASDANYYVIDGKPTRNDKEYKTLESKANILAGFDGTPDVKVGEASDIVKSEIRNHNNNGDSYNVADVATKIDKNGEGDIVAVYAYSDDMDEVENYVPAAPVYKYDVTGIQFANKNGKLTGNELNTLTGAADKFVVYVEGTRAETKATTYPVSGLKKENFQVTFGSEGAQPKVQDATEIKGMPGYYVLDLDINVDEHRAVTVTVVKADKEDTIVSVATTAKAEDNAPVIGGGEGTTNPEVTAFNLALVDEKLTTETTTFSVKLTDAQGNAVKNADMSKFKVYRKGIEDTDAKVLGTLTEGVYSVTLKTKLATDTVTVIYDGKAKVEATTAEKITLSKSNFNIVKGKNLDTVADADKTLDVTLSNVEYSNIEVNPAGAQGGVTATLVQDPQTNKVTVKLSGTPTDAKTYTFAVQTKSGGVIKAEFTVTVTEPVVTYKVQAVDSTGKLLAGNVVTVTPDTADIYVKITPTVTPVTKIKVKELPKAKATDDSGKIKLTNTDGWQAGTYTLVENDGTNPEKELGTVTVGEKSFGTISAVSTEPVAFFNGVAEFKVTGMKGMTKADLESAVKVKLGVTDPGAAKSTVTVKLDDSLKGEATITVKASASKTNYLEPETYTVAIVDADQVVSKATFTVAPISNANAGKATIDDTADGNTKGQIVAKLYLGDGRDATDFSAFPDVLTNLLKEKNNWTIKVDGKPISGKNIESVELGNANVGITIKMDAKFEGDLNKAITAEFKGGDYINAFTITK